MAGAGYKLFNSGDVLTAAQVNEYLMQQTVMVFDNAAARTTALSGVLAEGMMSYLEDTNSVEVYDGSAWVSISADQTPLTTKGDLFTFSTTDARLGVGANGETLVADSSATTGLRWQGNFAAGKNKIINGDFRINQRGFSSTTTAGLGFDRFGFYYGGGTVTYSAQTFTAGTAPVSGYEAINFARVVSASQSAAGDYAVFYQRIEDVRTLAAGDYTISFWAKAGSGTPKIGVSVLQNFGSGGSATVYTTSSTPTITTSWARYSFTLTIPSVSGKTIGASSFCEIAITTSAGATIVALGYPNVGIQNATFDIWGVQVEQGSVATAFQTATGTLAGELAACQRYFARLANGADDAAEFICPGFVSGNTQSLGVVRYPVPMRGIPTVSVSAVTHFAVYDGTFTKRQTTNTTFSVISPRSLRFVTTIGTSSLTTGNSTLIFCDSASATFDVSAEL